MKKIVLYVTTIIIILSANNVFSNTTKLKYVISPFKVIGDQTKISKADLEIISSRISYHLDGISDWKKLERAQLKKLIKEQNLSQSDLANYSTRIKVGLYKKADLIIIGKVIYSDNVYEFNARAIYVKNGIIKSGTILRISKDIYFRDAAKIIAYELAGKGYAVAEKKNELESEAKDAVYAAAVSRRPDATDLKGSSSNWFGLSVSYLQGNYTSEQDDSVEKSTYNSSFGLFYMYIKKSKIKRLFIGFDIGLDFGFPRTDDRYFVSASLMAKTGVVVQYYGFTFIANIGVGMVNITDPPDYNDKYTSSGATYGDDDFHVNFIVDSDINIGYMQLIGNFAFIALFSLNIPIHGQIYYDYDFSNLSGSIDISGDKYDIGIHYGFRIMLMFLI